MNMEEIDYWLRYFSNHNHGFMSEDGKKITLFKVFQELKELHYLLEIKNDYIKQLQQENQSLKKELEEYKLITIDYQDLEAKNQKYKEVIYRAIKYIRSNNIEVLKYHDIPSETTSYEIVTVDLLQILRGDSNK